MIGRLVGRVVAEDTDGALVVDVGGVGYELFTPLGTQGRAVTDADGGTRFYVHTHVREDVIALYGFSSETERMAFRCLLGVSNIGPKTALGVLSALPAAELAQVVARKDLKALTAVSGIGKKTAEMMLVQLQDKLPVHEARGVPTASGVAPKPVASKTADLLTSALTNLGYRPTDADRALQALGERVESLSMSELLREALVALSK